jgi:hypothetical protein
MQRVQQIMSEISLAKETGDFHRWMAETLVDLATDADIVGRRKYKK